jgi:hypothetical protein
MVFLAEIRVFWNYFYWRLAGQSRLKMVTIRCIFFLISIVWGGVQTGSTRHVGHFNLGLLYLPLVIVRMENLVE